MDESVWVFASSITNITYEFGRLLNAQGAPYKLRNSNNRVDFALAWNESYLYVAAKVTDNIIRHNSWGGYRWGFYQTPDQEAPPLADGLDMYISSKSNPADMGNRILRVIKPAADNDLWSRYPSFGADSFLSGYQRTPDGYTVEIAIPWAAIDDEAFNRGDSILAATGKRFRFDISNSDADFNNTFTETETTWNNYCPDNRNGTAGSAFKFGVVELVDKAPESINALPTIVGPTFLCKPEAAVYQLISPNNTLWTWSAAGGTITGAYYDPNLDVETAAGITILPKVGYTVNVAWNQPGLLQLRAAPLNSCPNNPTPVSLFVQIGATVPNINGTVNVCPGAENLSYTLSNTFPGYTYFWRVSGGGFSEIVSAYQRKVNWNISPGSGYVQVTPTDSNNCIGAAVKLNISIKNDLSPLTAPRGVAEFCGNSDKNNQLYTATFIENATYEWFINGGSQVTPSTTHTTTVNWSSNAVGLSYRTRIVTPTQTCLGDSPYGFVSIDNAPEDPNQINLFQVSYKELEPNVMQLRWNYQPGLSEQTADLVLFKKLADGQELELARYNNRTNSVFLFEEPITDPTIQHFYYLTNSLKCGFGVSSKTVGSMTLKTIYTEDTSTVLLEWTPYQGWLKGVKQYEVYRVTDPENPERITAGLDNFLLLQPLNLNEKYRIKAIANEGFSIYNPYTVWSNIAEVNLKPKVQVAGNIITPNNDGINDELILKNYNIFPQKSFKIYNRWGTKVFEAEEYNNNWNAHRLPDGLYYYCIEYGTDNKNNIIKGWVQVLR